MPVVLLGTISSLQTGKSVLNAPVEYTDFAFANLMKSGTGPVPDSVFSASDLNDDLYPKDTASLPNALQWVVFIAASQTGSGVQYVMSWSGTGSIDLSLDMTVISTSGTGTSVSIGHAPFGIEAVGTNARIVFTINTWPGVGGAAVGFTAGKVYTSFSNLVFCRASDEAAVIATPYAFMPEHIALVKTLNPKIYRLMDWSVDATDVNMSKYTYKRAPTACSYYAPYFLTALFVGTTAGAADAYTCSPSSDMPGTTWTDGMMFQVKFDRDNTTTTPTIQPTGFAAKTMVWIDSTPITVPGTGHDFSAILSGSYATAVYDLVLDEVILDFHGLRQRTPIEARVGLANACNKDYWHNVPLLYTNASVTAETTYIAVNLKSSLNAYFEVSNELWNEATSNTGFSGVSASQATILGIPSFHYAGIAYHLRRIMGLVTSAWGGRGGLNRVFAWQTVDFDIGSLVDTNLLQGSNLATVANGGTITNTATWAAITGNVNTSYRTVGNRPVDFVDWFSYAPYYEGAQTCAFQPTYVSVGAANIADLLTAADNYAASGAGITTALIWLDNDLRRGTFPVKTISSVSGTTINCTSNGFSNGQRVNFQVSGGTLPSPLATNNSYYVVSAATNTFSVSATSGGTAISLSGGSGTWTVGRSAGETLLHYDVGTGGTGVYPGWQALAALYSKLVICYEGGLQIIAPSTETCTTIGISTSYGGSPIYGEPAGKIDNLISGYKTSTLAATLAYDQFRQFMGLDPSTVNFGLLTLSRYPAWLSLADESQWALMQGDTFSPPWQTFYGAQAYNNS